MILEIRDIKNQYIFKFVKNLNLSSEYDSSRFLETFYDIKPLKITYKQLVKLKIEFRKDINDHNNPLEIDKKIEYKND